MKEITAKKESRAKEASDLLEYFEKKMEDYELNTTINVIDLAGNKHITSAFLEDIYCSKYAANVEYINVSKTKVCGEIFTIISEKIPESDS